MKRLLALFLCIVTVFSFVLPAMPVFAEPASKLSVYSNGEAVVSVSFPSNKTTQISAETAEGCEDYQWQIMVPGSGTWASIYHENSASLVLSQALIANMVDGQNTAYVRCAQTVSGTKVYTDAVAVTTSEAVHEEIILPEFVPAPAPVNEAVQPVVEEVQPVLEEPADGVEPTDGVTPAEGGARMMMFALPRAVPESYTIKIDYVFEDGSLAAQSWEGTFTEGSSYNLSVTSPNVNGYVADIAKIEKSYEAITADEVFKVTYTPTQVKYAIKHWQQNVGDDGYTEYTEHYVEYMDKFANDQVGTGHSKTYPGFKTLDYDTTTAIAADGSTVLNIYYDRLYYLMSFNLDGGYGVEPIYARYGTPISVGTPSKAGYSFTGWDKAIPANMPAENTSFTASWKAGNSVNVNVVFWYENANDDGYTYVGSKTVEETYTAGATVKSSKYKDDDFTGKDKLHFTYNAAKEETVELKADGSTIVNVYFTRKTYRMIFFNCKICDKNEDKKSCYPDNYTAALKLINDKKITDCVHKLYNDGNTGRGHEWYISVYTRKWQQNVRPDWAAGIAKRDNTRRWMPYKVTGADGKLIYSGTLNVSTMNVMPDADVIFYFLNEGDLTCTMNYYITPVPGTNPSGTIKVDGVEYVLKDKVVTKMGGITPNEEYVDIEGFTKVYTWSELTKKGYIKETSTTATGTFFYKRNDYKLDYISDGKKVKTVDVSFDALIKGEKNDEFIPAYPDDWETGAYEFKGWYLSETGADGTEVKWDTQKMPVGGFSVYARWDPVVHTVKIKDTADGSVTNSFDVLHGKVADNPPEDPTKAGYDFISWFYVENGVEKPFTFEMPINHDIELYPKWKQVAIVDGVISYKLEDGTKIAADSAVKAVVGDTKTYDAKANDDLYEGYREHYFPKEISHSILFDIDESKNVYTFVYVRKDFVPYTVKYLEKGTDKVLAEAKTANSTKAAVVENFKPIAGYLPDLYKKTLLLDADGGNELIFWYTKDSEHAPVLRGHYLENAEDDNYTTYQEILDGYGVIGETYSEAVLTEFEGVDIKGFHLNEEKSTKSGTLTEAGLELKLYYDRNLYPYEFRFEDENGNVLKPSVTGNAKFEATVTQEALVIPGYELIVEGDEEFIEGTTSKEIQIAIEEGNDPVNNVKIFKYKAALADLRITKSGANTNLDPNQKFMFRIYGQPTDPKLDDVDMTVTITGNGSCLIDDMPVGQYTVQELEGWSWRYDADAASKTVTLNDPENVAEVGFSNTRMNKYWLSGDSWCRNLWGDNSITATKSN